MNKSANTAKPLRTGATKSKASNGRSLSKNCAKPIRKRGGKQKHIENGSADRVLSGGDNPNQLTARQLGLARLMWLLGRQ